VFRERKEESYGCDTRDCVRRARRVRRVIGKKFKEPLDCAHRLAPNRKEQKLTHPAKPKQAADFFSLLTKLTFLV
jgi:hypothetical protein